MDMDRGWREAEMERGSREVKRAGEKRRGGQGREAEEGNDRTSKVRGAFGDAATVVLA